MLLKNNDVAKLGVRRGFRIIDRKKETGYELMSSSSSVSSLSSFSDGQVTRQLTVKEDAFIVKVTRYYIADQFNHFNIVTKKNLWELFPACAPQIKEFCKKNRIDYNKQQDLERLIDFVGNACRSK
jgi:hypothetical protein